MVPHQGTSPSSLMHIYCLWTSYYSKCLLLTVISLVALIFESQHKSDLKNWAVFLVACSDKLLKKKLHNFPSCFQILRVYREKFSMINRQGFPYKANCALQKNSRQVLILLGISCFTSPPTPHNNKQGYSYCRRKMKKTFYRTARIL